MLVDYQQKPNSISVHLRKCLVNEMRIWRYGPCFPGGTPGEKMTFSTETFLLEEIACKILNYEGLCL